MRGLTKYTVSPCRFGVCKDLLYIAAFHKNIMKLLRIFIR